MTTGPEAGYYADPSIPGYIRYWDGTQWVPGTSRPAQELLDQQQQRSLQQAVATQLAPTSAPAPVPTPAQAPAPAPQPEYQEPDDQTSVATMVVPSAYGSRSTYGHGGNDSPFASIPGLYRTVEPEEEVEPDVRVVELASAGSRILARIIDLCIAAVVSAPATVTLLLVAHRHDHAYIDQLRLHAKTTYRTFGMDALGIALWAGAVIVVLLTAIIFEAYRLPRTGQTTGRRLVGVQVVTAGTAEEASGGAAFTRALLFWLFAVIPLIDVLALGGILWGRPYRQGLHEKLSGTLSIRA
jgi:uncharacterized RDD family membrane protein YckC